jgi:uncharacterized protein YjcR
MTPRQQGRILFSMGMSVSEIATHTGENRSTVESWKQRDQWSKTDVYDEVTTGLKFAI